MQNALKDRYLGCILGGAAGDALGYRVEFWGEGEIVRRFGEGGIATLGQAAELAGEGGIAPFTDDTQMTLFTAAGMLSQVAKGELQAGETPSVEGVWEAYRQWLLTQTGRVRGIGRTLWLTDIEELNVRRAPGNTCLDAIAGGRPGSFEVALNHSKGCGGIMRVAPVSLFCARWMAGAPDLADTASELAGRCAALTHSHTLGWLPAAAMARMIGHLITVEVARDTEARREALASCACEAARSTAEQFAHYAHAEELARGVERAVELARADAERRATFFERLESIHELGEGWVGEEALYIAVYACVLCPDDFGRALRVAVNHRGDSDSTGAVAGNILGAYLGLAELETSLDLAPLQRRDLLEEVALELVRATDPGAVCAMGLPWGELYQ